MITRQPVNRKDRRKFARAEKQAKALAVAKTAAEPAKPTEQPASSQSLPQPAKEGDPWQQVRHWWRNLKWWWKLAWFVGSGLAYVWASLPHFSISRETVNGPDPMMAQFRFTNTGQIPAWNVKFGCAPDIKFKPSNSDNTGGIRGIQFQQPPIASVGHGESPVRGCSISSPGVTPSGDVEIIITYNIPMLQFDMHDKAYFSFRYDSAAGGLIFVPDVRN